MLFFWINRGRNFYWVLLRGGFNRDPMVSSQNLDIASLLAPVTDEVPAGTDARSASDTAAAASLRELRTATREARELERIRPPDNEGEAPRQSVPLEHWRTISDNAQRFLRQVSKDLEAAACLLEAQLRLNGFAGLRDAVHVAGGLVTDFWETLYPRAGPEESPADRLAAIRYLDRPAGSLAARLRMIPIMGEETNSNLDFYRLLKLEQFERIEDDSKRAAEFSKSGVPTREEIKKELSNSENARKRFTAIRNDVAGALAAIAEFNAATQQRCGIAALDATAGLLDDLHQHMRQLSPETPTPDPPGDAPVSPHNDPVSLERDEALRVLGEIAASFRRSEPHSPLSYLLDQAVRWGRLPLPDLMAELLPEGDARERYFKMTGLPHRP
jgi:type VI secretion system protein ImpA